MKIFHFPNLNDLEDNVSCIGYFDGVHLGHQKLINKTIELAKKNNLKSYIITFDGNFSSLMNKGKEITSLAEKIKLFESYGLDGAIFIKFDEELLKTKHYDFVKNYLNKMKIRKLVCGYDFTYGYKGEGNVESLKNSFIEIEVIDKVEVEGKRISSTLIKDELAKGNDIKKYIGR